MDAKVLELPPQTFQACAELVLVLLTLQLQCRKEGKSVHFYRNTVHDGWSVNLESNLGKCSHLSNKHFQKHFPVLLSALASCPWNPLYGRRILAGLFDWAPFWRFPSVVYTTVSNSFRRQLVHRFIHRRNEHPPHFTTWSCRGIAHSCAILVRLTVSSSAWLCVNPFFVSVVLFIIPVSGGNPFIRPLVKGRNLLFHLSPTPTR